MNGHTQKSYKDVLQPDNIPDLSHALDYAASTQGCIFFHSNASPDGVSRRVSYADILNKADEKSPAIVSSLGHGAGRVMILHFDNQLDNISWFWAAVKAGYTPALSTPFSLDSQHRTKHLQHLRNVLRDPVLLTSEAVSFKYPEMSEMRVVTVERLHDHKYTNGAVALDTSTQESAILMLTSGSSGNSKVVSISMPVILGAVRAKAESWSTHLPDSVYLNWVGFDHVVNLVEAHLHAMLLGINQVQVLSDELLADPLLFVEIIDKYRVTHNFSPNFFLNLVDRALATASIDHPVFKTDISCFRGLVSGGEANVVSTALSLAKRLGKMGMKTEAIRFAFGMTETCAGCISGVLDPAYEAEEQHEFGSIGTPMPGAQARVTTPDGHIAPVGTIGSMEVTGAMVFNKYFNNATATRESFTQDGWFITGDQAFVDRHGRLNLTGRTKEVLNINGVNYAPQDIESALERHEIPDLAPSCFAVFPHRPKGGATEGYAVLCGAQPAHVDEAKLTEIARRVSELAAAVAGLRPQYVIAVPVSRLDKSTLGKLSRAKLRASFEAGQFGDVSLFTAYPIRAADSGARQPPTTKTEEQVVATVSEMLELPLEVISMEQTIFDLGITSISLFRLEKSLKEHIPAAKELSIVSVLNSPGLRSIAALIDAGQQHAYEPVTQIAASNSGKMPLWLVHPASGSALAFLHLARVLTDRPLYSFTARGLRRDEALFGSLDEMASTYVDRVRAVQPRGPYALTGYSLGTTIAYEMARRLEGMGETVAFCGALDCPPDVRPLVEDLDWAAAAVYIPFFFGLIRQEQCPALIEEMRPVRDRMEVMRRMLDLADPRQRQVLGFDPEQLRAIVDVSDNYGDMLKRYRPAGDVRKVDVFYCQPLHHVDRSKERWLNAHLVNWRGYSREGIEVHECEGEHADMLSLGNVVSLEKTLSRVLMEREREVAATAPASA